MSYTRTLLRTSIFIARRTHTHPTLRSLATMSFPVRPNTEPPKDMTVFRNLPAVAALSEKFRRVLWTGRNSQVSNVSRYFQKPTEPAIVKLVIMTIPVGGEIGEVSIPQKGASTED